MVHFLIHIFQHDLMLQASSVITHGIIYIYIYTFILAHNIYTNNIKRGKENIRPPDEDRIVRTGPSIWHWSWDLSFGLYDDIYDNYVNKKHDKRRGKNDKNYEIFLEETWLNLDGPIPSWQPLFAAIIWFIIAMNILFPVSIIAQATPCPHDYYDHEKNINHNDGGSNWHSIDRTIFISSSYAHFQVGIILFSFEISRWITTPISSFLILKFGPSWMLFVGILLMIISYIAMSFQYNFFNISFVIFTIICRIISGIGFNIVRQSTLFLWSCFAKLDMLSSGLGFCVGPVFGDLLYTYTGINYAYIVYAVLLFIILIIVAIVIIFKLLSLEQISRLEIPNNIKNIRKPRYDLFYNNKINVINNTNKTRYCLYHIYIFFKLEILMITIIGLIGLEPTLPVYALDPDLDITVSGALFTFIYLPLLALSSLIGLIYAKSSSKFLNSPKKHVKKQRRGMKYITKTLSINFSGMNQNNHNNNLNNNAPIPMNDKNKRFNVSKSEKIKLVVQPSWLSKKKKLLPSPDISQHDLILLFGLGITSLGYLVLSGGKYETFVTNSNGVDLVLGLVLISIGSAFIIISCCDSFINGLSLLNINQTQLIYIIINISILFAPLIGGFALDLSQNNLPIISKWYSFMIFIHFAIYLLFIIIKSIYKCCRKIYFKHLQKKKLKKREESLLKLSSRNKLQNNNTIINITNEAHDDDIVTNQIIHSHQTANEYFDNSPVSADNNTLSNHSSPARGGSPQLTQSLLANDNNNNNNNKSKVIDGTVLSKSNPASLSNDFPLIRDLSMGKIQPSMHNKHSLDDNVITNQHLNLKQPLINHKEQQQNELITSSDDDDDEEEEEEEEEEQNDEMKDTEILSTNYHQIRKPNKKRRDINIKMFNDIVIDGHSGLKQRVKPKNRTTTNGINNSPISINRQKKNDNNNNNKNKNNNNHINNFAEKVYIYGTDLRHLCWWKRGLNVRFPYVQWMESGWSSTNAQYNFNQIDGNKNKNKKKRKSKSKKRKKKNKFNYDSSSTDSDL